MKRIFNKPVTVSSAKPIPSTISKLSVLSNIFLGVTVTNVFLLAYNISPIPSDIFARASKSVVTVSSMQMQNDPFAIGNMIESVESTGTGFFIIDKDHIITNAHVIQNAFNVRVTKSDGTQLDATVVGADTRRDIALLSIATDRTHKHEVLKHCTTASHIGDPVLAIGNPFGFDRSMSSGIISGVQRTLDDSRIPLVNLLQTDAAINPGNSGGPLIDANRACVVGVNTVIISPSGGSSGVNFAIPIQTVDKIANSLLQGDTYRIPQLGVAFLPDKFSNALGVDGIIIAGVIPGGVADALGLVGTHRDDVGRPVLGDMILGINNIKIKKQSDFFKVMDSLVVGDVIELCVGRPNGIVNMRVTL